MPPVVRVTKPGPPAGAGQASSGFTGRDFVRLLRKRMWMIVIILALFIAMTVGGTYAWLKTAPFYQAEAYLQVQPPEDILEDRRQNYNKDMLDRIMTTQASMVKSTRVLTDAGNDETLATTQWFKETRKTSVPEQLDEDVSVRPIPNSNLLKVSMTGTERKELPIIVDAVAKAAVRYSTGASGTDTLNKITLLNQERDQLVRRLDDIRRSIREAKSRAQAGNVMERRESLLMELRNLVPMRTMLEVDRDAAKEARAIIEDQREKGILESSAEILTRIERDPRINSLRSAEMGTTTRLDNLLNKLGPEHRDVKSLQNELKSIRDKIKSIKAEIIETEVNALVELRKRELEMIVTKLQQVALKHQQVNEALRDVQSKIDGIETLEEQADNISSRIERIENRLVGLRIHEQGNTPMTIVQPASLPEQPTMPQWKIMIPLGIVLGLVVGVGLAVLLEFVDTSVRTPADIIQRVDLPMLGMVPHVDDMEENISDLRTALLTNPSSLAGESFRQIRTNLLFSGPIEQRKSLLVTSASPGDGRTTVAVNLAAAVAQAGRKVLVVDANFRQQAFDSLFPQAPDGGLSSALVGQADWREQVAEVQPNLHVMAAGPLPPNPSDLLGSEEMGNMIEEMNDEYDQVIFDGAPCLVVTDPVVMSSQVAGVLLVVRAEANTHGIVGRVKDTLHRVGAHITGVVLNGVRATSGGYLRKNYETFYEYHETPKLPSK